MISKFITKRSIIFILSVTTIALAGYFILSNGDDEDAELVAAEFSRLEWEVFDTGELKRGEEISLGFEQAGTISAMSASRGDEVERGTLLAQIDNTSTRIRLSEAQERLRSTELELQRLRAGAPGHEIDLRTSALDNAKQKLEDVLSAADTRLANIYSQTPTVSNSTYATSFATLEVVDDMIDRYFTKFLTFNARTARDARDKITDSVDSLRAWRNLLRDDFSRENAESASPEIEKEVRLISSNLDVIIDIMEDWEAVSDENTSLMKQEKVSIDTALSEWVGINSSVASARSQNTSEINAAEGAVRQAERELTSATADARDEDVSILETRITQARLEVSMLRDQLDKTSIRAPFAGTVTRVHRNLGETVPMGQPVFSFMPKASFFIEANIYEGDISKVSTGDEVIISFVAFPNREHRGEVVMIDSASTLIDGVVYYTVTIAPEELPERAMAGMTVDISILTEAEEDSLVVPDAAIQREGGRTYVNVSINGRTEEREVVLGSRGANRTIEILSGLEPGDRVIIGR